MVSFNIKFIALLLIILTFHVKCEMSSDNVVVALNCGGNTFKDSRGIVYQKVES